MIGFESKHEKKDAYKDLNLLHLYLFVEDFHLTHNVWCFLASEEFLQLLLIKTKKQQRQKT